MSVYVNDSKVSVNNVIELNDERLTKVLDDLGKYGRSFVTKKVYVRVYSEDTVSYYDLVEVVLNKVYGSVDNVDEFTRYKLGEFLSLMNSRGYGEKENPIGFDDWLLKLSIDNSELFEYLSEWEYTKEYVSNFDYNFKNKDNVEEISTKIYFASYNGRLDLLENYFVKYIEKNGGLSDDLKSEIVSILEETNRLYGYYDVTYANIGVVVDEKDEYDKLLETFKLTV